MFPFGVHFAGPPPESGVDPMAPEDRAVWSRGFAQVLDGSQVAYPADIVTPRDRLLYLNGALFGMDQAHVV